MPKRKSTIRKHPKPKVARTTQDVTIVEKQDADEKSCTICFEPLEEKQFLPCTHVFHPKCIETWLTYSNNCPLCRNPIHEETVDIWGIELEHQFIYNMTFPEFFEIFIEMSEM
jgi:hypothetical protein